MTISAFDVNAFAYATVLSIPEKGETSHVSMTNADANIDKKYYSTLSATATDDANGDGNLNIGETITLTDYVGSAQNVVKSTIHLTVLGSGTFTWTSTLAPGFGGSADVVVTTDGTKTYLVFANGTQSSHYANNHDPSGQSGPRFGELVSNSALSWRAVGYKPQSGPLCFCRGTMIDTDCGPVAVEDLMLGDLVLTKDNGPQPIRWIGATTLDAARLALSPQFRPIRIAAGALGRGLPTADLLVSPQHRILIRSKIVERISGVDETLIAAKQLLEKGGISIAADLTKVEYFHILFDQHQVITSNGAETESMFPGPMALRSVSSQAYAEIFALFPELGQKDFVATPARHLMAGRQARDLVSRHQKHGYALI